MISKTIYHDSDVVSNKYLTINLNQNSKNFNILSLTINQEGIYDLPNSNFGVLVGRVNANDNVGVPNAKISVFIPISDTDKLDSDIFSLYPYESTTDLNNESKRYNLLPRLSLPDENGIDRPKQPFGTFFTEEDIATNQVALEVYEKYYKYTAITNSSGDYMIYGIPVGTYTVHMSADVTDIGRFSMSPLQMIENLGYSEKLFTTDKTLIKSNSDLTQLPNLDLQDVSVDIRPFWGDKNYFEVGVTRQDFKIRATVKNSVYIFASTFTMGNDMTYGDPSKGAQHDGMGKNQSFYCINTTQHILNGDKFEKPIIKVYTYSDDVTTEMIEAATNSDGEIVNLDINPETQIIPLPENEYYVGYENGDFLLSVTCNRKKVITNDKGYVVDVSDDYEGGIFTKFYGMITVQYEDIDHRNLFGSNTFVYKRNGYVSRGKLKIPQNTSLTYSSASDYNADNNKKWRTMGYSFEGNRFYSIAQFIPTKSYDPNHVSFVNNPTTQSGGSDSLDKDKICNLIKVAGFDETIPDEEGGATTTGDFTYTFDFPDNYAFLTSKTNQYYGLYFGAQWLNLCVYLPQYTFAPSSDNGVSNDRAFNYADVFLGSCDCRKLGGGIGGPWLTGNDSNNDLVFSDIRNTNDFLRGDSFSATFIKIPHNVLAALYNVNKKGINVTKDNNEISANIDLVGTDTDPYGISRTWDIFKYRTPATSSTYSGSAYDRFYLTYGKTAYIYKGFGLSNIINYILKLNIL